MATPGILHFDVSSGLKTVLGGELITNDEVAIFELVKNSFDAAATRVDIAFQDDSIVVADDGAGMSLADIRQRWLFVAYSAKRGSGRDFRDEIATRHQYAGSKGIGRFSSDRLGQKLLLQTRSKDNAEGPVHRVSVNWAAFDRDHRERFDTVSVEYTEAPSFSLPTFVSGAISHGTVISILELRKRWDRAAILRLKSALAKLINPFGSRADGFRIFVHAPRETATDTALQQTAASKKQEVPPNALVNGEVGNFIFAALQERTTFLETRISEDGNSIESALTDRGELIYRILEPNPYALLAFASVSCSVFFLNQSAKLTFARRMGVPSVQFGSVFLFRNGFRVYPVGEEGDDWFGMDRRKQQGYARFLGSRDVIGRIDVAGAEPDFQEASSRNAGLIETSAVQQLRAFFLEHCLKRLERYVVPVTFVDKEDKNTPDVSRLLTDPGRARVSMAVARLVDNEGVQLLDYSKRLIALLDERSSHFEASLSSLRSIADKTQDKTLFQSIEEAQTKFAELRRSEEEAKKQADEERRAKEAAQSRALQAEARARAATELFEEEKKRNLFLTSISSLDSDTILNLHHQVTMYAVDVNQQIENFLYRVGQQPMIQSGEVMDALERISLLNKRIMGISKFATRANFRLRSEMIEADLGQYVQQYIESVAKDFLLGPMRVHVSRDDKGFPQKFKPIDVSIVIDNLIANAKKSKASNITFDITHPSKDAVHIAVADNGKGFHSSITDLERIFDKGFTTTDGSGLGLYHVRLVLGEMNGTIAASRSDGKPGASFLIRIAK